MRSHLSILSACAVSALLLAGCGNNDKRDYYPEDRTATSPAPKRLKADLSTNVYGNKEYQKDSEKVIVATEDAVDWSVKPGMKPMVTEMPAVKPDPVSIQPIMADPIVPMQKPIIAETSRASTVSKVMDNDYLGDVYQSTNSPVLESYKQVAGSNFETRTTAPITSNSMPRNVVSSGSVEVFDVDAPASTGGMMATNNAPQSYQARAGVTIYPLDGVNPMQPQYAPTPMPTMSGNSMDYSGSSYGGDRGDQGKIYFKHGSERLGSGDKRRLADIAQQAKTSGRVEVEGYASQPTQAKDAVTSKILNLKESMNRSFAVSKDLIKKGVPADKIKTVGWGDGQATGDESQDRRVDVTVNPY